MDDSTQSDHANFYLNPSFTSKHSAIDEIDSVMMLEEA